MTIQERTDALIHQRTSRKIFDSIKEIRDKLLNLDNPLKVVYFAIDHALCEKLCELGMEHGELLYTMDMKRKTEEETRTAFVSSLFVTDKFKDTEIYKRAFSIEFDKFWQEAETKLNTKDGD